MTWRDVQLLAQERDLLVTKKMALRFMERHAKQVKRIEKIAARNHYGAAAALCELLTPYCSPREPFPRPKIPEGRIQYAMDDYDRVVVGPLCPKVSHKWGDAGPGQEITLRSREDFISTLDVDEVIL